MRKSLVTAYILLVSLLFCGNTYSQKTDKKLQRQLDAIIQHFNGDIGIFVHDLNRNKIAAVNADTIFPTASIVKVPILVGIMHKLHSGELNYHQDVRYRDSLLYPGSDILGSFKDSASIELSKVIMLMLTTSDNTASLWLQSLAGGGKHINTLMDSLGLMHTKVNSRTPGREAIRNVYGWGQTTPKEMATLFHLMLKGAIINDSMSQKMIRLLGRNYWDEEAINAIPASVFVASKNGAVNASRSEVMFVNGQGRKYIFSIFTKNNKDVSWEKSNEAWELTRKISKLLWEYLD
jgi:beta-lactamase class A